MANVSWTSVDGYHVGVDVDGRIEQVTIYDSNLGKNVDCQPVRWAKSRGRWENAQGVKISTFRAGYSRGTYKFKEFESQGDGLPDDAELLQRMEQRIIGKVAYEMMMEKMQDMRIRWWRIKGTREAKADIHREEGDRLSEMYYTGMAEGTKDLVDTLDDLMRLLEIVAEH